MADGKKQKEPRRLKCHCKSEFQDKQCGAGFRPHNHKTGVDQWTCISCGNVKGAQGD